MIIVIWCCHVRREMRVSHVMLQNALYWLHECSLGFVLGGKPEHETLYFPCKVVAAGDERYLVCAAVAAAVVSVANVFLCVLQRVVVPVCVVLCFF